MVCGTRGSPRRENADLDPGAAPGHGAYEQVRPPDSTQPLGVGRQRRCGRLPSSWLVRLRAVHTSPTRVRRGIGVGQTASQRAEALLRELRHLQDNVQALLKGPRPDVRADQDLVTGRQGRALYLIRDGAMTMGQLASELGVQPGAATAVADRLVQLGLAERLRSPLDRRLVQISATERGIQLMRDRNVWEARALGALAAALEQVEPGYGLTATDQLIRLLEAALEVAGSAGQTTLSTDTTAALRITALETDAVS